MVSSLWRTSLSPASATICLRTTTVRAVSLSLFLSLSLSLSFFLSCFVALDYFALYIFALATVQDINCIYYTYILTSSGRCLDTVDIMDTMVVATRSHLTTTIINNRRTNMVSRMEEGINKADQMVCFLTSKHPNL